MVEEVLKEREEYVASPHTPHLSYSRVSRYLLCPEQYRLYYIENLRTRYPGAGLVFGQIVHKALTHLFRLGDDPVERFSENWEEVQDVELSYNKRESWEGLRETGQRLLEKFVGEELPRISKVEAAEQVFELSIASLEIPFIGFIDLIGELDGKHTVVDFKTSVSSYESHEVLLSDQLTAYKLAKPETEQVALCVLVKTKNPKIEWHVTQRSAEQLTEFLAKAGYVAHEIALGQFYKRPGKWCSWCDYLPVCLGETRKVKETLVSVS